MGPKVKTIFATAAALTLSLTLAACSGSEEDTADAGEDPWANIPLADEIVAPADEAEAPAPADEAGAPVDAAEALAAVEPEGGVVGIVEPEPVVLGGPENTLYLELACGRVVIEMRPDLAPLHVEQIKTLTREGFYDGVVFHRVIEGFMAQSGDPTGTGFGASQLPNIPAEFTDAPFIRGAVGMGRGEAVDSANSQFFIMFAEGRFLDGLYTLWGHVTVGMDCVDQIARGEPPANPDVILTILVAADAPADEAEAPAPADEAAAPVDAADVPAAAEPEVAGIAEPEPVVLGGPENTLYLELACGRVVVEMRPDLAPLHVERIKALTRSGFYDGVIFHRVIEGFMAQSGDPTGTGFGGSPLPDLLAEFSNEPFVRGAVGMARGAADDSANSQFFIMFDEGSFLDGLYTLWGHVSVGMDCVDQIARGEPPANPDVILTMLVAADAPADEAGVLSPAGEAGAAVDAAEALAAVEPEGGAARAAEPEPVALVGPENTLYLELACGRVVIEMRPDLAPLHVEQIKTLTREGFYDGVVFHRVIEGFMA